MTEQQGIGPGSIVRLKSGGPAMVVSRGKPGDSWLCHWMTTIAEANEATLPEQVLCLSDPDVWPDSWGNS